MGNKIHAYKNKLFLLKSITTSNGIRNASNPLTLLCYNNFMLDTRPSPIAGTWYEANPETLAATIDSYLNNAQLPELNGQVVAVIAPHAGHTESSGSEIFCSTFTCHST